MIERWSAEEERQRLRDTLVERGSDALLAALQKIMAADRLHRTSTSPGWDVSFARATPFGDGGRRIVLATDRPLSFWELRKRPRSVEPEFTLAEIRLAKDGKGVGKRVDKGKVSWNKDTRTVEIENHGSEPVRLTQVPAAK